MSKIVVNPLLVALVVTSSGCSLVRSLPNVKATEIHSHTSTMGVTVTANATGVTSTETSLKAANAEFSLSFPGFSHVTTVKDYQQRLPKEKP